jgi:hypothetical protein
VRGVVGGISSVFAGLVTFMSGMWNGLGTTFSSVFTTLGDIVSGFGNFFLGAFSTIGTAVGWLQQQFGNLCSFAVESFGAIAAALGRGDIEAAIQVIWASIKLIWVKGSTSLLSTWYWVVETLQTAWANCVFKISELLTSAWYGVQAIWTDSVYTMQVAWITFMNSITQAWDYVSTTIAHGIGYIMAKIMGLDPNQMAATITEDYDKAIEAFDFALVCDDSDVEIKILKAFCCFLKEDFEKMVEIYKDVVFGGAHSVVDCIQPSMDFSDQSGQAYSLIKKMIEKYDNMETGASIRSLFEPQDEEVNGLLNIADCFPGSLLFLLFNEMLSMAEGKESAIHNIEQIIQSIYQHGTDNVNFKVDAKNKFCMTPKQKIEKCLAQQIPDIESVGNGDCIENQIIRHLLDGNTGMFCQLYAQSSSDAISAYLEKIFPAGKKRKKQHAFYLGADEIYRDEYNNISSNELSAKFMTNKNLHN